MRSTLNKIIAKMTRLTDRRAKSGPHAHLVPHGEKGIAKLGHREYIGGLWEEIGNLQFDFLRSKRLASGQLFARYRLRIIAFGREGHSLS